MKNPTIKDVARLSKFSIATVSRVLNGKGNVSSDIAKQVLEAAEKLNYIPNQLAKGLKEQKSNIIGVVVPDLTDPYFMQVIQLLQNKLHQENIHIIVTESQYKVKKEQEILQQLESKRVDSILIASTGQNEKQLTELVLKGINIVLFHSKINNIDIEIPQIIENEEEIANKLTTELINQGHRYIGVINGTKSYPNAIERYVGYVKAMYTGGEVLDTAYTYEGAYEIDSGKKAVKRFLALPNRPTAIVSLHPHFTIGAIAELQKRNVSIPKNITIASLGNNPTFQAFGDKELIIYSYDIVLTVEEILFYLMQ